MAETIQKGIGAVFHVNGETRAMRDFFATIRNTGIQSIDPRDAHVTIIDSAETQVPVFSERDQISLNRARARASAYLATMPYYELVLGSEDAKLGVFGKRLGIVVAETDFMLGVRKHVGEIFEEEAGISLSHQSYVPHMSVGLKTRGLAAAAKRVKTPRIPRRLHVVGHAVNERVFYEEPSRQRAQEPYRNNSSRLRAVS